MSRVRIFDLRILIRGNSAEFASQKSSDISALDSLFNLRCVKRSNNRRVQNLHMKAYLIDDTYLLITSGNLTHNGMFVVSEKENFEGGISSCNARIIGARQGRGVNVKMLHQVLRPIG